MANANTSLNGYEYGSNPKTTAPFWGGSGEGAEIDDSAVVTDKTWSSKKINDELAEKADADDVYTKSQVDEMISEIPTVDAYTKSEVDDLLDDKANVADVYTKSQVDNLIPDVSGLATKTELNSGLATKADETELVNYAKVTSVYTKAESYSKAEVDNLIEGVTPTPVDAYTKAQTNALLADKADVTDLANYAKVTSVYTKSETYTKTEVNSLIEGAGGSGFSPSIVKKFSILGENSSISGGISHSFYDGTNLYNVEIEDSNWSWAGTLTVTLADDTTVSAIVSGSGKEAALRYLPWNSLDATTELPLLDVGSWKTIYIKGIPLRVCVCGSESYSDLNYPYVAFASETGTPIKNINFTIPSGCHITLESNSYDPYIYRNNGLGIMQGSISRNRTDINAIIPNRMRYDPATGKKQYWQTSTYPNSWVDVPESSAGGGLQEYEYTITSPDSTTISTAIMSALVDAITNVGIDNLEKLRKIVAKTEYTFGSTPHVIEHIYDVKYTSISKGGGNFDDIDICAVGGENYYAAGDNIKTTKLIASRYNGILNTVEQSGTNPVVTSTDHSSTNVDSNTSPWYHNGSSYSDLAYKIVFVYG